MYFYKKTDIVIFEFDTGRIFPNQSEKNVFLKKLIFLYENGTKVNRLRHRSVCSLCQPSLQATYSTPDDSTKKCITDCELMIAADAEVNYLLKSIILHYVDIHNYRPDDEIITVIENSYAAAFYQKI